MSDGVFAFVKKTEGLETPRAVEQRRLLRSADLQRSDIRGQLTVKETLPVLSDNAHQHPTIKGHLEAVEEQNLRR